MSSLPPPPSTPAYGGPPPSQKPDNYLVWAILSTIFCCLPLGVVSIVYAAQVDTKWNAGDATGALQSSERARKFALYSAIAAVVVAILWIIFVVMLGLSIDLSS